VPDPVRQLLPRLRDPDHTHVVIVHAAARKDRRRSRPPTELQRLPGPP
jgi:hypothetical protein